MGAQWQIPSAAGNKRGAFNFEGGLVTGAPSFNLKDDQSVNESGWDTTAHPALHTRLGRKPFGSAGNGMTRLLTNFGNTHLVRAAGTRLQYFNGSDWADISGSWTDTDWDATNFDVNGPAMILTNGTDAVQYWNGSTLAALSEKAPKGRFIASDNRRVYIATGDSVNYCAFQDATDWISAENSGIVEYYTSNGGDITALKSFEGQIWAFKKDAFCLIFHTGDARATHRLVEQSSSIGCVAYRTLQEVGSMLFWLGQNEVYMGSGGAAMGIGFPIKRYLDAVSPDYAPYCLAGTDGIRYYLGLTQGASNVPSMWLVYDPRYKKWRVYDSNVSDMRYSAILNTVWYCGGQSGTTYQMNTGTSDNGSAIPWTVETKDFDEGMPEAEKEYYELHIQYSAPSGTSLTVSVSTDMGNTYQTIGSPVTVTRGVVNANYILPLDTVELCNWARFKFSGSGEFTLHAVERYFRYQPVQH